MQLAENVAGVGMYGSVYKIFTGKVEGNRQLRRPKYRLDKILIWILWK
jgi:hypothetical protein